MRGRDDHSSTPRPHPQMSIRKIKSVFRMCAPSTAARTDEGQEMLERMREENIRSNYPIITTVNSEMERMERLNYREDFASLLERHNERERIVSQNRRQNRRMSHINGSDDVRNGRDSVRASGPATRVDRTRKYHTRRVNSVQWYPVDSGCFMTAGNDHRVIMWDAIRPITVA